MPTALTPSSGNPVEQEGEKLVQAIVRELTEHNGAEPSGSMQDEIRKAVDTILRTHYFIAEADAQWTKEAKQLVLNAEMELTALQSSDGDSPVPIDAQWEQTQLEAMQELVRQEVMEEITDACRQLMLHEVLVNRMEIGGNPAEF